MRRYLTPDEKAAVLADLDQYRHELDQGIVAVVDALNALDGVVTVQSCEGHVRPHVSDPDVTLVESGTVELRLSQPVMRRFQRAMPYLASLPDVEDVAIHWRAGEERASVVWQVDATDRVGDQLVKVLRAEEPESAQALLRSLGIENALATD